MAKDALKNIAYNYIFDAIVSYKFQPNQAIVEQDISEQLGISRTPIREAIRQLTFEGLVTNVPSTGTFVKHLAVQDIEEIFQIRTMFELTALKSAVELISDSELERIEKQLISAQESSENEVFYRSDRDLHWTIIKYSCNSRIINFYNTIESQHEMIRRLSSMTPQRLSKSRDEHKAILDAIYNRDLTRSEDALRQHLENVKQSSINVCRSLEFDIKTTLTTPDLGSRLNL